MIVKSLSPKVDVWDIRGSNVATVCNALELSGAKPRLREPSILKTTAALIVLPGMSSPHVMRASLPKDLRSYLSSSGAESKVLLAICMGMQILFDGSDEEHASNGGGIGYFPGRVKHLGRRTSPDQRTQVRTPHTGWRTLTSHDQTSKTVSIADSDEFYFAHSYGVLYTDQPFVARTVDYCGLRISAYVQRGSVHGVQFHPEMSGQSGIRFLRKLLDLT